MAEEKKVLLEARGLTKEFRVKGGTLSAVSGKQVSTKAHLPAIRR